MITVNAMGDVCPIPVIKTRKAIGELGGSGQIEVLVDNETAVRNVTKMAESSGAAVSAEKLGEGKYRVNITVGAGTEDGAGPEEGKAQITEDKVCECGADTADHGHTVVVVPSDKMGNGDDELGHILMKSFLFAVTQLDELRKRWYSIMEGKTYGGGFPALEDLKSLEEQGVEIMTCGTALTSMGSKINLLWGP